MLSDTSHSEVTHLPRVYIDHISILVRDLDKAVADWAEILGALSPGHTTQVTRGEGTDAGTPMVWATFQNPDPEGVSIQLWASPDPSGWVNQLLDKRGEYVHHIAFLSDDFQQTLAACRAAGLPIVQEKDGFPESMPWLHWNFISPDKAHGPLIEIATRYFAVGDGWYPHPGNAENAELRDELKDRFSR